jgi:hypothetical protein
VLRYANKYESLTRRTLKKIIITALKRTIITTLKRIMITSEDDEEEWCSDVDLG